MKTPLGFVLVVAVAGGIAGGAGAAFLLRDEQPASRVDRGYDDSALRADFASLREEMRRNLREMAAVARAGERETPSARAEESTVEIEQPETPGEEAGPGGGRFVPSEFVESLRGKSFTVQRSDALMTYLSLHKEQIGPTIEALEKAIKADPSNPELYAALASAHVSKLAAGVAVGPAAGGVFMAANAAYKKALELNPDHWDARFGQAFTVSMAPPFLGYRPAAIKMFEGIVERQAALPKRDEYRRTYLRLGELYKDAGNPDKAKEVWKTGLQNYPDDEKIKAALDVLEK